jgi:hypothetical protein
MSKFKSSGKVLLGVALQFCIKVSNPWKGYHRLLHHAETFFLDTRTSSRSVPQLRPNP